MANNWRVYHTIVENVLSALRNSIETQAANFGDYVQMTSEFQKTRILHVITALQTGGAEMMLLKLVVATYGKYCHEVISGKDAGTIGSRIKALGVPVHELNLNPSAPNPLRAFTLRSLIRRFSPDIIQGWMYHGNLLASLSGILASNPALVLWNIRQSVDNIASYGRMTAAVIRLGAFRSKSPKAIIYNSESGARQHEALGYDPSKTVIIPNGFDCRTFHPDDAIRAEVRAELGIADDHVVVGLFARYHPMKDHVGFIAAAAQVLRRCPYVRFLLAGRGVSNEQPELTKMIQEYQLQDHVFLLGERHDTPRLMLALDVACSASAWGEGFSNAIGEAMACGVPCVVTDVGDSSFIVGATGISTPPANPAGLAQGIIRLIEAGPERRQQLGLAARQRIENDFSISSVARRYQELYHHQMIFR